MQPDAVVVVELSGNWYYAGEYFDPYEDVSELPNEILREKAPSVAWKIHDVRICDVLWGQTELQKNEDISLGFGSPGYISREILEDLFASSQRYVLMIKDCSDLGFRGVDVLYGADNKFGYYLTDDDVLVSMADYAGLNECSGMYLDAFARKLRDLPQTGEQ